MNTVPVITGLGLVTPLGRSTNETWQALLAGKSITTPSRVESNIKNVPRVSGLAIEAATEAVAQAAWADHHIENYETALVVGTSKGPIESWITSTSDKPLQAAGRFDFGLAQLTNNIARAIPLIDGPKLALSAACASGLHALIRAALMIRSGQAARVLVVAAEASVHPLFLASFQRLGVLPPLGSPCRPFDQNRSGFLMSEAAAAICLESRSSQITPTIAAIENYALGGDAHHLTAGDPKGTTLRRLLQKVINDKGVDLIHAHGTGTIINDPIELDAIAAAIQNLPGAPIPIYSHKGALGHSLGAAGLISVVLNCMSHQTAQIPSNINTPRPLNAAHTFISNERVDHTVHRSIASASGFGGAVAVMSLTSP